MNNMRNSYNIITTLLSRPIGERVSLPAGKAKARGWLKKILTLTLILAHIITFGPVGDTLAYIGESANYKLRMNASSGGSYDRTGTSCNLALEVIGEVVTNSGIGANYRLSSGFVYNVSSNPPVNIAPIPNQLWDKSESLANAFCLDNYFSGDSALSYSVFGASQVSVNIDSSTHIVSFSSPAGYFGNETIYFIATDLEGKQARSNDIILQVRDANNPPIFATIPEVNVNEAEKIIIDLAEYVTESDGDAITYTVSGAGFALIGASVIEWQTGYHDGDAGIQSYNITVTAQDKDGQTQRDFVVKVANVNRPPVIAPIVDIIADENELITLTPIVTDEDGEAPIITYSAPFNSDGTWQPAYNDAGTYTVTVTASDPYESVSTQFGVTVQNVNRPPAATLSLSSYTLNPDEQVQATLTASDPDADNMIFVIKKDGAQIASGEFTSAYTISVSFSNIGDHTIQAIVTDDGTPQALSSSVAKTINVVDPNANRDEITPVMGDFNGDCQTDIGYHDINTGAWHIALATGGVFTNTTLWLDNFGTSRDWIPISGDFNGDGFTDIGVYNNTNGSDGGKLKIALSAGAGTTFIEPTQWLLFANSSYDWQPVTGDFNIDRYTDFGVYNRNTGEIKIAACDGVSAFGEFQSWITGFGNSSSALLTGDFNADGLPDVCAFDKSSGSWRVALNNTKAFVDAKVWLENFARDKDPLAADFNNDGFTDIGYWDKDAGEWHYAISTGDAFVDMGIWCSNFGTAIDDYAYTGDFNGDGITTPALFDKDKNGILKWNTDASAAGFSDEPSKQDLLVRIANNTGGITEITYDYAANYTDNILPFPVYVVKTVTSTDMLPVDAPQEAYGQYFDYAGGYYDAQEREFRGFRDVTARDGATGNYTITRYYQGRPGEEAALKGKIRQVQAYAYAESELPNKVYRLVSEIANTWGVRKSGPTDGPLGFAYLEKLVTTVYEDNGTSLIAESSFIYDNLGNVIRAQNEGDINRAGDAKITQTAYTAAYENGYNRPLEVILKDEAENIVTKKSFEYYPDGNLKKETALFSEDPAKSPSVIYAYDDFGNVTDTTNANSRTVHTDYESAYYIFPQTITNELGHAIHYQYNAAFGAVTQVTDTNGYTTATVYDTYARAIQQLNADNQIVTSYSYPDFNTKVTTQSAAMTTTEYVDGLGRAYKTVSTGEYYDPSVQQAIRRDISKEVYYNERGFVEKEALPHYIDEDTNNISYIEYTYDSRGRVKTTIANYPGTGFDAYSQVNYLSPLVVESVNAKNQRKTTIKDVYGNVIEVIEYDTANGEIHTYYTYDIQGNLTQVTDDAGNITQMRYDSLGRKVQMTDPDMGTWNYAYDKMGNLISQTDAKNQTIVFEYDNLNRLLRKYVILSASEESTLASYAYDDPAYSNSTGRLSSVTDANGYITTYNYDKEGRIISSTSTIDSTAYTTSTTYDLFGRMETVTYPDAEVVLYTYDAYSGQLNSVSSLRGEAAAISLINRIDYNAAGQIDYISYGNNTNTKYAYHNDHKLENINTKLANGSDIQNLHYAFDQVGNITQIRDNIKANTKTYSYDDLNRLTQAVIPDPVGGWNKTINYQYNSIGNMTYNSDLGSLAYGQGAGPHAVTSAGGYAYAYDANGNQAYGRAKTMEYDAENHLTKIITASGTTDILYDADGKRVKKVTASETTTYVSGSYEIRNTNDEQRIIKHIFTGSDRSITIEKSGGQTHTYYHHNDHLGSTSLITDESGIVVQECEYSPYGQVISNTGAYDSPYKFTGKELDASSELYYYGARYYDPVLCHFIQADTIVPDPMDPQAFNRYSYCRNNPIIYTDPSGHSWLSSFFKGLLKGAVSGFAGGLTTALLFPIIGPAAFFVGGAVAGATSAALNGAGLQGILIGACAGALLGGGLGNLAFASHGVAAAMIGGGLAIGGGVYAYKQGKADGLANYAGNLIGGFIGGYAGYKAGVGINNAIKGSVAQRNQIMQAKSALETDQRPSPRAILKKNYDIEGKVKSFDLIPESEKLSVYRQGRFADESTGWKGNFVKGNEWATENPLATPDYSQKYGLPLQNTGKPDWIVGGSVSKDYGLQPAPPSYNNIYNRGGGIEVTTEDPSSVTLDWFHMPD